MWRPPDATRRARALRRKPTKAEATFWTFVRGRQLAGLKFRRQEPVAGVTCDFVCLEARLVVELDGGVHRLHEEEDALRDARLRRAGYEVIRSPNEAFLGNPNLLLAAICRHAGKGPPSPLGGEGGSRSDPVEGDGGIDLDGKDGRT